MQGWARGVIYGVLKCIESQRLEPSQTHSHDSALPYCFNMACKLPPLLMLSFSFLISISAILDLFVSHFSSTFPRLF